MWYSKLQSFIMATIMNKVILSFAAAVLVAVAFTTPAFAPKGGGGGDGGSPASNKAYFGTNDGPVMLLPFADPADSACGDTGFDNPSDLLCTPWQTIYYVEYALKTSTNGGVGVYVSLECSLWTDSEASAMIGATGSGGSRAGVEVRVQVNGAAGWEEANPGNVVFCDRLQYLELTVPFLTATVGGVTGAVTSTSPFIVGLFQRTKNAHSFNYYLATGASQVGVKVEARGIVQCFKDGAVADCSDSGIDIPKFIGPGAGTIEGGTKAVIGKSSFVIEEHNNWNSSTFTSP